MSGTRAGKFDGWVMYSGIPFSYGTGYGGADEYIWPDNWTRKGSLAICGLQASTDSNGWLTFLNPYRLTFEIYRIYERAAYTDIFGGTGISLSYELQNRLSHHTHRFGGQDYQHQTRYAVKTRDRVLGNFAAIVERTLDFPTLDRYSIFIRRIV